MYKNQVKLTSKQINKLHDLLMEMTEEKMRLGKIKPHSKDAYKLILEFTNPISSFISHLDPKNL